MYCDNWTSERLETVFSPGRGVDLRLPGRDQSPRQVVRQALVLGRHQDDLALSQPQPPLPQPVLGQPLEVTILVEDQGQPQRYAYLTNVLDFLDSYPEGDSPMPAVVVMFPRCQDVYATSLRRARRYRVRPGDGVSLAWRGHEVQLMDLSIKGLRYRQSAPGPELAEGEPIDLVLTIHDEGFRVRGRVAGVSVSGEQAEVSVELGILPLDAWASLQELIQTLEPQNQQ